MTISSIDTTSAATLQGAQRPSGPPAPPAMTNTAKLLGISTDQLSSDLQAGQTVTSLASRAGVSSSDLLSSVKSDMTANKPQGAPDLPDDQLTAMATGFIDGVGSSGGPGGPGGPPPAAPTGSTADLTGTSNDTGANLQTLADALGVDSDTLFSQLTSGQGLNADALRSAGQTGYGSTVADSVRGGVVADLYA